MVLFCCEKTLILYISKGQERVDFLALKDGVKIIIQDVVEPEKEKEGCLTKIGSFIVVMVVIIGLLNLLFRFLMNHPFIMFLGIGLIIFFIIQASKK